MRRSVNHPVLGQTNAQVTWLSGHPDAQVDQTVGMMRTYALEDSGSPLVSNLAYHCQAGQDSELSACLRLYRWMRSNMRFVNDEPLGEPVGWQVGVGVGDVVEVLIRPQDMLALDPDSRIGDCDDYSMLAACVLAALKIPCEFRVIAADLRAPDRFSHVYVVAYPQDENGQRQRISMDCSHGPSFGWEAPEERVFRSKNYPVLGRTDGTLDNLAVGSLIAFALWGLYSCWNK